MAIFKQNSFFFQILFQKYKCIHVLLLNQIALKNFIGKVAFQILVTWLFSQNENSFFGGHFETQQFFNGFFADLWFLLGVYKYGVSFVPKFLQESI